MLFDFKCRPLTISDVKKVSLTSNNWKAMVGCQADKVRLLSFIEFLGNEGTRHSLFSAFREAVDALSLMEWSVLHSPAIAKFWSDTICFFCSLCTGQWR